MWSKSLQKNRFSGILFHLSSLPSNEACGTFGEPARKWVKLLSESGISVWQLLPLSPVDSLGSPYSSPSSFALNPWFLDASDLVRDGYLPSKIIKELPNNSLDSNNQAIDFNLASLRSDEIAKALVLHWNNQSLSRHLNFNDWRSKQFWLDDHSCFMEMRRQHNGLPWWEWPTALAAHDDDELNNWRQQNQDKLLEHSLVQWHLDRQLSELRKIARDNQVLLFGDLPFYVSRDSSDVWSKRDLFSVLSKGNLLTQSGVPPDYFSDTGQLWGTPVYRWDKHKRTRFKWWRDRIGRQWSHFDLLRLDHFRALDSYWSVPGTDSTAEKGCWLPSPGLELLLALEKDYGGRLPLVAEDLGVITSRVDELRNYFGFPGMKILQFAFDGNPDNPYLPENITGDQWVVYTGTHDNSTTNGWWQNSDEEVKDRVSNIYNGSYEEPSWMLIEIGLKTDAILFISPIQDILSLGESARLNKPGTINNNWCWRLSDYDLNLKESIGKFGNLSSSCGRGSNNINILFK